MATIKKKRPLRRNPYKHINAEVIEYFKTGYMPEPGEPYALEMFLLTEEELLKLWEEVKENLLNEFNKENPGQKPFAWFQFEAPELTLTEDN